MKNFFTSSAARRNGVILLVGVLLLIAFVMTRMSQEKDVADVSTQQSPKKASAPGVHSTVEAEPVRKEASGKPEATPEPAAENAENPSISRTAKNRTVVTPSGVRKQLIDPMASWTELPAWPEGPRLFAEVETAGKRFVNLRPDDVGEMPRVQAGAEEEISITISIPEGDPGEKIYLELPNGGSFKDSESKGRVLTLSEDLKLTFSYITDRVQGYCNVKLRHRGHTRSLPVWVGELPVSQADP